MPNPQFDMSKLHVPAPAAAASSASQKKPASMVWLNLGYIALDAEGKEVFVNLPLGVPFDDLAPIEIKANASPNWKFLAEAKNRLLASLREVAPHVGEGAGIPLEGLTVQMYRRSTAQAAASAPGENPLLATAPVFAKTG